MRAAVLGPCARAPAAGPRISCGILHGPLSGPGSHVPVLNPKDAHTAMTRPFRISRWLLWLVVIAPWHWALAVDVQDLYETEQPLRGSQEATFAEALRAVVVRVSGLRDAPARLGAALDNPRRYVQRFGVTEDGRMQVGFDDVSINRLLSAAGLPVWGRERPQVLVLLEVIAPDGSVQWLTSDSASPERDAIARAARERGLPILWSSMDATDRALGSDPASMLALAEHYRANATLVGRSTGGGAIQWTLFSVDGEQTVMGAVEDGVHMAADSFARVFAATGSQLETLIVQVSGITNLDAYAGTLNYLEGLTLVRSVALEQVAGDTIRLRLAVHGDGETLRRAIGLERRLLPVEAVNEVGSDVSTNRLAFRYQP